MSSESPIHTAPARGPKNLILCSDGTGNRGGRGNDTNVWRLYNSVKLDSTEREQRTFYHDGVGTDDNKVIKAIGGACGWGLSSNIRSMYKFLLKNYELGDSIYLFGFSRGAFTVRSLAGFIAECGILDIDMKGRGGEPPIEEDIDKVVMAAFDSYRFMHLKHRSIGGVKAPLYRLTRFFRVGHFREPAPPHAIRKKWGFSQEPVIKCVGVWDTVGAIGAPTAWMRMLIDKMFCIGFHSHDLSKSIQNGFHALSIDDERHSFTPTLWNERESMEVYDDHGVSRWRWSDSAVSSDEPSIQQVWFAGVHSNVGGGYPKQGMAGVSLYWMMQRAEKLGVEFDATAVAGVKEHANVNDRLYDSRSGVGSYYRYRPRNIDALCEGKLVAKPRHRIIDPDEPGMPWIHASVFERIRRSPEGYAPGNIPPRFDIDSRGYSSPGTSRKFEDEIKKTVESRSDLEEEPNRVGVIGKALIWLGPKVHMNLWTQYQRGLLKEMERNINARIWLQRLLILGSLAGLLGGHILLTDSNVSSGGLIPTLRGVFDVAGSFVIWLFSCITSPIDSALKPLWAQLRTNTIETSGVLLGAVALGGGYYTIRRRSRERMRAHYRRFWRGIANRIDI